jgi:CBS domain-containing protein
VWSEERLKDIAAQLKDGKAVPPVTVRDFLSWFGAQRRGYWIVLRIREALADEQLQTDPDFESAYIDSSITFRLAPQAPVEGQEPEKPPEPPNPPAMPIGTLTTPAAPPSYADPSSRLSKLAAANRLPACVAPDGSIQEAITIMLANDFSQLPVMVGERDVKGVVSWGSIGARLALGKKGSTAREFMDSHQEIRADASLFQAIPIIVAHQYVLIRGADNRITGIVTASDLSLQFQQLTEPFLLLGEIENHVRQILGDKFGTNELAGACDPSAPEKQINCVADLTFGEYIRLMEDPDRWGQLNIALDRATFCKQLDRMRKIRNDVMHFDPDGIPLEDLNHLRDFARFLQWLQSIGVT